VVWVSEMIRKIPCLINLKSIGSSELGYITVAENNGDLPFEIKRVYWTYFTPQNVIRGRHSHHNLEQVIFASSGVIDTEMEMYDGEVYRFRLDQPHIGLYIPAKCWGTLKFSHNAVLICMASMEYDESDYIRSYEDFKKLRTNDR
jgi:dTDP-4-dehydrorhamnose 3,5-epimerase-like enzyme